MSSTIDPTRRAQLNGQRLRAIAADHGVELGEPAPLGSGAAAVTAAREAWVLLGPTADRGPGQQLGAALAWTIRNGATALHVIADDDTGTLARRSGWFTTDIRVSHLDGRAIAPAVATSLPDEPEVDEAHRSFVALIVAGGATPVEEHGVLAGEVDGLEVCRVVDDPVSGEPRLEVGVGAHDREAFQLLHGDRPTVDALHDVVGSVAEHRRATAAPHPLQQLAASRRLRARLIAEPSLLGLDALVAVAPPIPRSNVKEQLPCAAIEPGSGTLVVCTTGIDLDVVPWTGDAAARHAADRCIVAAPERDAIELQHRLASLLRVPTELVGLRP